MELNRTQTEVNQVWEKEWQKGGLNAKALFGHRIFIEGYPVVKKYIPSDVRTILDVGSATGRYAIKFAQDFPTAKVCATDIVESALHVIEGLARETGVTNVVVQREDVMQLSFPDNHFDIVYSGMVLQGLPNVHAAMSEMKRVLKPGGVLIITTVNFWNSHTLFKWYVRVFNRTPEYYGTELNFSARQLRRLFAEEGIPVVACDGFYPAYGIYRLKSYWKPAALIGKLLNRITKIIDPWTGRLLSRWLGFEIFVVGKKR